MKAWTMTIFLALAAALVLGACTPPVTPDGAVVPSTGETDELFINMMVPHHQGAIEMARIALNRAEHTEIQEMAVAIIASQEAEIEQMRGWKLQWYGSSDTPPMSEIPSMQEMPGHGGVGHTMDMQAEVDALRNAPEPFDLAFIDAMLAHHTTAVQDAQTLLQTTERAELRELGEAIIAAQQREIEQLQTWRQNWYPDAPLPTAAPQ